MVGIYLQLPILYITELASQFIHFTCKRTNSANLVLDREVVKSCRAAVDILIKYVLVFALVALHNIFQLGSNTFRSACVGWTAGVCPCGPHCGYNK